MTRDLFLQFFSDHISEKCFQHLLCKQLSYKCYKVYEDYRDRFKIEQAERQKTSFPKECVENAELYKPVINKIMTTHE